MTQSRLLVAAGIILAGIIVVFFLSVPHAREVPVPVATHTSKATQATAIVTLKDTFKNGTHTYSGSLLAPDACTNAQADAVLTGDASSTQTAAIAITLPVDTDVCLQVPTPVSFSTTLEAPRDIPVQVTVNGAQASTTAP